MDCKAERRHRNGIGHKPGLGKHEKLIFSTQIENFANFAKCQNLNFESDEVVGWHVGSLDRAEAMQGVGALSDSYTSR